eukprot:jgi/Chlat1/1/ChrspC197367S00724
MKASPTKHLPSSEAQQCATTDARLH